MIRPRVVAYTLLALVIAWLAWPREITPDPAIENGIRAAKSSIRHRQLATAALARRDSAIANTNALLRKGKLAISTVAETAFVGVPVSIEDGHPIIGTHLATDTLVPLPLVRLKLHEVLDAANVAIAEIEGAVMIERGRSSLAIQHLQRTIAAQDTVIQSLKIEIAAKSPPFYKRATSGAVDGSLALACSGISYVAAGPLGLLVGPVCVAVKRVVR